MKIREAFRKFSFIAISCGLTVSMIGCGGEDSDCDSSFPILGPSGRWSGVMQRVESDCGEESRGPEFSFVHDVYEQCISKDNTDIQLVDENNRQYNETSSLTFDVASFSVKFDNREATIDISYENYFGSTAIVTEKIRLYKNGKITCSEKYTGRASRE